jgi:hypothetical protein
VKNGRDVEGMKNVGTEVNNPLYHDASLLAGFSVLLLFDNFIMENMIFFGHNYMI